jgi:predicted AlkP superfamily pyrophosphatase or phosphodiesterase
MDQPANISRVIVVVLDGLRPDAISAFHLHHIQRLMRSGVSTMRATTVSPSITAAAMTSLLTGVHPQVHGLRSDRLHIPSVHKQLFPVPRVLNDAGIPTFAFMRELPLLSRPFAHHIAWKLGVERITFRGKTAPSILMEARHTLQKESHGFFLLHWTDADQAGHEFGWMSDEYREATKKLDASLGLLCALTNVVNDPSTLLIALADHGGGGDVSNNHESTHPHDWTIPIILCGGAVTQSSLRADVSLVDVPPTILHALDVAIPSNYAGRPLTEAFMTPAYAIAS